MDPRDGQGRLAREPRYRLASCGGRALPKMAVRTDGWRASIHPPGGCFHTATLQVEAEDWWLAATAPAEEPSAPARRDPAVCQCCRHSVRPSALDGWRCSHWLAERLRRSKASCRPTSGILALLFAGLHCAAQNRRLGPALRARLGPGRPGVHRPGHLLVPEIQCPARLHVRRSHSQGSRPSRLIRSASRAMGQWN